MKKRFKVHKATTPSSVTRCADCHKPITMARHIVVAVSGNGIGKVELRFSQCEDKMMERLKASPTRGN